VPVEAYFRPTSLDEALDLTAEHDGSLEIISGGTLTMPAVNEGHAFPDHVMDLRGLDLDYVESSDGSVRLGATTTLTDVIEAIDEPILRAAAEHTGSWAVRNLGTVGGNLFAPPPLGDFAVALLALDADVGVRGQDGDREITLAEFYTGPGEHALASEELVTEIRTPSVDGETAYLKHTRNQEPAPPIVTVAANLVLDGDTVEEARLALNGAGPHPVRMGEAESTLEGAAVDEATIERAAEAAADEADPPEDAVASAWYRRKMVGTYVEKALAGITEETAK